MLIIDGKEEEILVSNLKILNMYYRNQAELYDGLKIGQSYKIAYEELHEFLIRIGVEISEK